MPVDDAGREAHRKSNKAAIARVRERMEHSDELTCTLCRKPKAIAELVKGQTSVVCKDCKWKRTHRPKDVFAHRVVQLRLRAKAKGLRCTVTADDLGRLWNQQQGRCHYSGIAMMLTPPRRSPKSEGYRNAYAMSVDRVQNRAGYTACNVVLCCLAVNIFKNRFNLADIRRIAEGITRGR